MIDAKTVEELRALWRERNEATSCAACGGPYPNADCGHAKNAADVFQPAPCRPDTARAESSEALVAELREKVERLKAIIESIGKRAYTRGDRTFDDAIRDLSWIDDECRRARSELEAGHE